MDDDELLKRIRSAIDRDLAPVRPLRAPWIRALLPVAASAAGVALVVGVAGMRDDAGIIGSGLLLGVTVAQVASCAALFVVCFRWAVPGMSGSRWTALVLAAGALVMQVLATAAVARRSAIAPSDAVRAGLACFSAIAVVAVAPLATGAALLSRGLVTAWRAAYALLGFASGVAAEAAWRLHCPYSTWDHVLLSHWAPVAFIACAALAAARAGDLHGRPVGARVRRVRLREPRR